MTNYSPICYCLSDGCCFFVAINAGLPRSLPSAHQYQSIPIKNVLLINLDQLVSMPLIVDFTSVLLMP